MTGELIYSETDGMPIPPEQIDDHSEFCAKVEELLEAHPLVVVFGEGGTGKTVFGQLLRAYLKRRGKQAFFVSFYQFWRWLKTKPQLKPIFDELPKRPRPNTILIVDDHIDSYGGTEEVFPRLLEAFEELMKAAPKIVILAHGNPLQLTAGKLFQPLLEERNAFFIPLPPWRRPKKQGG